MFSKTSLFMASQLFAVSSVLALESQLAAQIEAAAKAELNRTGTPSLQVAVSTGGQLVYQGAFGLADIENSVRAGDDSRYRTASVAKWFSATAAMRLVESGQLDLDAPVQRYCPRFPNKKWKITTRQLMTQTSGIRGYVDDDINTFHLRYTNVIEPLVTFDDDPLSFEPGTKWQYTSFGYQLLGCVIEGAAGSTYRESMRTLVFQPADMTMTVPDDAWEIIPGRVQGYRLQREKPLRRADYRDVSANLPAGGYLSSATDLVKFVAAYQTILLTDTSRRLMESPVTLATTETNTEKSWRDAIPTEGQYGYGVMLFDKYEDGLIGHTGRQAGASAILLYSQQLDLTIAVMSNAKGWNGYLPFSLKLLEILSDEP